MSVPRNFPSKADEPKAYVSAPRRAEGWLANRPGEVVGGAQPSGPAVGNQGPDQGYMHKLAKRFEGDLVLAPQEYAADVLEGACAVALRRASLFGRAPVADDLRVALTVFGYLGNAADELVAFRRPLFEELHHLSFHYFTAREIADLVPESTLRMAPAAVAAACAADWRVPLGL